MVGLAPTAPGRGGIQGHAHGAPASPEASLVDTAREFQARSGSESYWEQEPLRQPREHPSIRAPLPRRAAAIQPRALRSASESRLFELEDPGRPAGADDARVT